MKTIRGIAMALAALAAVAASEGGQVSSERGDGPKARERLAEKQSSAHVGGSEKALRYRQASERTAVSYSLAKGDDPMESRSETVVERRGSVGVSRDNGKSSYPKTGYTQ
ncbi:hypothetical protein [Pelagicoccus sp. SDUM812003]|uniref:hypothetical protein n=1 Tax=Pelagicoccus sp. SDUM812003 TaxID=3041267 RepID=UPI00280E621F|nr:hypothetical protein [Pelagicoccus sp. SDUM812003]MDQ8203109.1 hypothetical protein [Pelagicoccus sp. SDUM812003]